MNPCQGSSITDDHPSISDIIYVVSSAAVTGAFTAFTSAVANCLEHSMELYDDLSSTWKMLDSINYPTMNNIVFTFTPGTNSLQVGVFNDNSFGRSTAY